MTAPDEATPGGVPDALAQFWRFAGGPDQRRDRLAFLAWVPTVTPTAADAIADAVIAADVAVGRLDRLSAAKILKVHAAQARRTGKLDPMIALDALLTLIERLV